MVATMVYCCHRHSKNRPDYGSYLATPQQQGTECSGKYVSKSEFYGMGVGCCYCQRCGEFMMFLVDRLVQEAGMQQSDRKWKKAKKEAVINNKISRVATSISQNELKSSIAANFCPTFFWLRFSFLCYFFTYWFRSIR